MIFRRLLDALCIDFEHRVVVVVAVVVVVVGVVVVVVVVVGVVVVCVVVVVFVVDVVVVVFLLLFLCLFLFLLLLFLEAMLSYGKTHAFLLNPLSDGRASAPAYGKNKEIHKCECKCLAAPCRKCGECIHY
jgi:hypothetical protein